MMVNALMSILIMGIMATVASRTIITQLKTEQRMEILSERRMLRSMIDNTYCGSAQLKCNAGQLLTVNNHIGNKLSAKQFNKLTLRARCTQSGVGLQYSTQWKNKAERKLGPPMCQGDPGLECKDVSRRAGTVVNVDAARSISNGILWGLQCNQGYVRTGCDISTHHSHATDMDIHKRDNSCLSDDEEWSNNATIHITCCRR